jgi:hypothetical protein
MDINKEADEYAKTKWPSTSVVYDLIQEGFITGANSKYAQAKVIQGQIGLLSDMYKSYRNGEFFDTEELIQNFEKQLQQQLKELEDENGI